MAKRSQKTVDKDLGYKRVLREIKNTKGAFVQVGYFGELGDDTPYDKSSVTVTQVATYHEFGVPKNNLPERSFLRSTADRNRAKYRTLSKKLFLNVVGGDATTEGALSELGETARTDVVLAIRNFSSPPLAESTKKRKASGIQGKKKKASFLGGPGNPLVDTGAMMGATSYGVVVHDAMVATGGKAK
jgi:hypothetical protein